MTTIYTGLDIESTGLEQAEGHRIIEISIIHYNAATKMPFAMYEQRIDPQRPIDAKAQSVHGIAYTDLVGYPVWDDVAHAIHRELSGGTDLLIAHNAKFDLPFIAGELARVGLSMPPAPHYCTMENGRWACFDGKLPKLQELCFALGLPYDPKKAHAAEYDVERMMACFFAGQDRGFFSTV